MQVILEYIGGKLITYICFTVVLVFRAQVASTVIPYSI